MQRNETTSRAKERMTILTLSVGPWSDCHFTSIIDTTMLFICWKCKGQCHLHTFLPTSANIWTAVVLLTSRLFAHSGHEAKISVELLLMSAICLGRKWSLSHPEEISFEKYELEAWRISLILKKKASFCS